MLSMDSGPPFGKAPDVTSLLGTQQLTSSTASLHVRRTIRIISTASLRHHALLHDGGPVCAETAVMVRKHGSLVHDEEINDAAWIAARGATIGAIKVSFPPSHICHHSDSVPASMCYL